MQLVVIAFEGGSFEGKILTELRRLREEKAVDLIDLLFVAKDLRGEVVEIEASDLSAEEAAGFGHLVRALFGCLDVDRGLAAHDLRGAVVSGQNGSLLGPGGAWFLADAVPTGTAAAVALIEHRWAIPLRDAIEATGGHDLVDRWIHPADLAAIGSELG